MLSLGACQLRIENSTKSRRSPSRKSNNIKFDGRHPKPRGEEKGRQSLLFWRRWRRHERSEYHRQEEPGTKVPLLRTGVQTSKRGGNVSGLSMGRLRRRLERKRRSTPSQPLLFISQSVPGVFLTSVSYFSI